MMKFVIDFLYKCHIILQIYRTFLQPAAAPVKFLFNYLFFVFFLSRFLVNYASGFMTEILSYRREKIARIMHSLREKELWLLVKIPESIDLIMTQESMFVKS